MLELGGAFSAALAVDGGQIVDGLGGSAGPIGARACGALDAEAAYLLGGALSKETVFSGGALDPQGARSSRTGLEALRAIPHRGLARARGGRREGRARADRLVPAPREILVAGRACAPGLLDALARGSRTSRRCGSRQGRAAARGAASWPTAWRAGATPRWSSACASATRAAPRSTTSGSTAPSGLGCADGPDQSRRPSRRRAGR